MLPKPRMERVFSPYVAVVVAVAAAAVIFSHNCAIFFFLKHPVLEDGVPFHLPKHVQGAVIEVDL